MVKAIDRASLGKTCHELEAMSRTELSVLLWDIDGTMLGSGSATIFTEYTRAVLEAVFGTAGRIDEVSLTGMTDLQYIAEALAIEFTRTDIMERLQEVSNRYLSEIERAVSKGAEFHVLPGVRKALELIATNTRSRPTLLPVNSHPPPYSKPNPLHLSPYLDLPRA